MPASRSNVRFAPSLTAALLALALASPAFGQPAPAQPAPNDMCIRAPTIVSTDRVDDTTILFHLRDHQLWKNVLPSRCFGLKSEPDGFTYQPTDPSTEELCSNQVTIRLNTFRTTCLLGNFTRVK